MRNPMRAARVKRWGGLTRTVTDWDGLRRDPELWFEDGDCLVHLHAHGQSRRGPSFRVPLKTLRRRKCGSLLSLYLVQMMPTSDGNFGTSKHASAMSEHPVSCANICELYIPAPEDASREASFQWHITTRNFFAFLFGKPLVGNHMGQALVELQERMQLFRSGQVNNHDDFLEYADKQGYRDFVECADYALAMLYYGEHYQLRDVYIDAFAHCVGMNELLCSSPEFESISCRTKALITQSYLEVDIHLSRVTIALSNFLEDDLSSAFLGLTDGARAHLNHFRSFLQRFYAEKFGYWPPPRGSTFSKPLYKSMYFDFKNLHDYLVDVDSTPNISSQNLASGGICVLQNVQAFDIRHKFPPLVHPLPLLPRYESSKERLLSQKTLRTLTHGPEQAGTKQYQPSRTALTDATNSADILITSSPLVQAYMRFERQCTLNNPRQEKVSMTEARKIRWLLIYGVLQYLISALRAPDEVRDIEEPAYPLCCLISERLPWLTRGNTTISPTAPNLNVPEPMKGPIPQVNCGVLDALTPGTLGALEIQPDCQSDDYFAHTNPDVRTAPSSPVAPEVSSPPITSTPLVRNASVRSFGRKPFSALGSRKSNVTSKGVPRSYSNTSVQGYGNGLNETIVDSATQAVPGMGYSDHSNRTSKSALPADVGSETTQLQPFTFSARRPKSLEPHKRNYSIEAVHARTPSLPSFPSEQHASPFESDDHSSSANSFSSSRSTIWSDGSSTSSRSSTDAMTSDATNSGVDDSTLSKGPKEESTASPSPSQHGEFRFDFENAPAAQSIEQMQPEYSQRLSIDFSIGVALSDPPNPRAPDSYRSMDFHNTVLAKPESMPPSRFGSVGSPPLASPKPKKRVATLRKQKPESTSPPRIVSIDSPPKPTKSVATLRKQKPGSTCPPKIGSVGSPPTASPEPTKTVATLRKQESQIDIFSALSLAPGPLGEVSGRRSAEDVRRNVKAVIPASIIEKSTLETTKVDVDEDKQQKKARRKSLSFPFKRR